MTLSLQTVSEYPAIAYTLVLLSTVTLVWRTIGESERILWTHSLSQLVNNKEDVTLMKENNPSSVYYLDVLFYL